MTVVITGADGFLGRHLRSRLLAAGIVDAVSLGRAQLSDPATLAQACDRAETVVHLAGVNRGHPTDVEAKNVELAERLVDACDSASKPPRILYANSVHAGSDSPYGRGKQKAAELMTSWAESRGSALVDVRFQNLFGESGRPDYNSFVATFCDRLATGRSPVIEVDRPLEVMHAQDAAQLLMDHLHGTGPSMTVATRGRETTVKDVLHRLEAIAATYGSGTMPDLHDQFDVQLFNTYRSYVYPTLYPFRLTGQTDARGSFFEAIRSMGGEAQTSFSTTRPGVTRGNHFHLRKVERFLVVKGTAQIAIRPVYGTDVTVFDVSGDEPAFVDMPTLHSHNITNVGDGTLYTLFWINELYDAADPDTFLAVV
jgi:UDP-2-acetamido-2,6-beta-L-arabino-hexul-4-ose reductase